MDADCRDEDEEQYRDSTMEVGREECSGRWRLRRRTQHRGSMRAARHRSRGDDEEYSDSSPTRQSVHSTAQERHAGHLSATPHSRWHRGSMSCVLVETDTTPDGAMDS